MPDKQPIRSMTGFGSAEATENAFHIRVDLRTVNNRYFKFHTKISEELSFLGGPAESIIRKKVARGTLSLSIQGKRMAAEGKPVINEACLEEYLQIWKKLQAKHKLPAGNGIDITQLLGLPGVVHSPEDQFMDPEALEPFFKKLLNKALDALIAMRETEGSALTQDMTGRIDTIRQALSVLTEKLPSSLSQLQDNFFNRVSELMKIKQLQINPTELMREIAIIAEKTDITEEVDRLKSHLNQMSDLFQGGGAIGRKLDFLTQEMLREVTTMGAKVNCSNLAQQVLDLKIEVDRLKEQAQNIE